MPESTQNDGLFVGRGAPITGNVALAGKLTIDGQIDGEISAKEIHVGEAGKISGKITAAYADVRGEVLDSISVSEMLILRNTAKVRGTITYSTLQIEQGALIEGSLVRVDRSAIQLGLPEASSSYVEEKTENY